MSRRRLEDIFKTSWRCLEDVFADVLKTFWGRLGKTSWRRFCKMSWRRFCKTSWRRLQNVLKSSWQDVFKTSWRHLENVLKTSWRCMTKTNIFVLIKTSWRRMTKTNIFVLIKTSWRHLLKTKTKDVFKTSSRRLHQEECLLSLSCFKQPLLSSTLILELCHFSFGEGLLIDVVGGLTFLFGIPLDCKVSNCFCKTRKYWETV